MLDLSRLDRILDLDLHNGTARIEPGVTFWQLQAVLKEHGLSFHLPAFGGPGDASVLANAPRDRCGFLWICPVVPLNGAAVRRLIDLTDEASRQHSLFAAINLRAVSLRAAHAYISLAWDRDQPHADERALACQGALLEWLWAEGFLPFRLALPAIDTCSIPQEDWIAAVSRIRRALDPAGVLAPGRTPGLPS